jgi:Putative Actinobacterial Holin-X, holin superfamily III
MTEHEPEDGVGTGPQSIADELAELVRRQVDEVTEALRGEIARVQEEVAQRGRTAARGAGFVGAAGALGLVSAAAVASLPLIALRKALPPSVIALALAGGAAAGAVPLLRRGLAYLKEAAPESVEQRINQVQDDIVQTLKTQATGSSEAS